MSMFRAAQRSKTKLRLSIIGPSGAGKTYSALLIAFGLEGKTVVIDSENGSADLYSNLGEYDVYTMQQPYEPEKLITVIRAAEAEGYDTIIIDSLSHYWAGEGGLLDRHTKIGGNSYTAWAKVTPVQQRLIESILSSKCHIIANMRAKQEYVMVEKNGKQVPEKVGLSPIQRDQIEFEFSLVLTLNMEHIATTSKDRTGLFDGQYFKPSEETGRLLREWLETGEALPVPSPPVNQDMITKDQQKKLFATVAAIHWTHDQAREEIKKRFGLESSNDLTRAQASELIDYLVGLESGGGNKHK